MRRLTLQVPGDPAPEVRQIYNFIEVTDEMGKKVEVHGTYLLNGDQFVIREGGILPDGAEFTASDDVTLAAVEDDQSDTQKRALAAAPQNKARTVKAPEVK